MTVQQPSLPTGWIPEESGAMIDSGMESYTAAWIACWSHCLPSEDGSSLCYVKRSTLSLLFDCCMTVVSHMAEMTLFAYHYAMRRFILFALYTVYLFVSWREHRYCLRFIKLWSFPGVKGCVTARRRRHLSQSKSESSSPSNAVLIRSLNPRLSKISWVTSLAPTLFSQYQ